MTTFVVALACAVLLTGAVTAGLGRLGVIDVPNHRSSHVRPVPRGGGAAVVPSVALALALTSSWDRALLTTLLAAAALGLVGLLDDLRDVPAVARLVAQVALAVPVSIALLRPELAEVGGLLSVSAVAVAVVWLTGFVNVFNFMDGSNGTAALTAAVAGGWFAWVGSAEGSPALQAGGLALAGAVLGFLPWNFPRARVFMGDVGSYSVGTLIGCLAIVTWAETGSVLMALAPTCVFLCDTTVTLVRRVAEGKPPMTAHREHVYQRLTATAGSPVPALATSGAAVACVLAAGAAPALLCVLLWAAVLAAYVSLPRFARLAARA